MTELKAPTPLASVVAAESRPLALIVAWFAAVALASGIWWNVPFIDDWTYAWSVERLLTTSRFEVLDWTGNFALGQVVWGAAWSALLGFSFASLRLSTLVLAVIGCGALYVMLRDFEVPRGVALVGALTLAVNPAFAVLSASFMTDVPFTACAILSLFCYVRAARFVRPQYLWWAGWWAVAAFSIRQVGIVVPFAGVPLLLSGRRPHTIKPPVVLAALGVTWSAMAALWLILEALVGRTSMMSRWVEQLQQVFLVRLFSYFVYNLDLLIVLAFFLLPVLLCAAGIRSLWRRRATAAAAVLSFAIVVWAFGELPLPLASSETWNLREIGSSRALVSGPMPPQPRWLTLPVRLAGLFALTLLAAPPLLSLIARWPDARVAILIGSRDEKLRRVKAGWRSLGAIVSAGAVSPAAPLLAFIAGYAGIVNLMWLYNDRYYLALIPPGITLVLAGLPVRRGSPLPAWLAVGVFAAIALVGSRDAFRFNVAIRDAGESLVRAGVPASDIDAGYAWNGWVLYAHPEHSAEGVTAQPDVPWINSSRESKYLLSKTPMSGYEIERAIVWTDLPWPGPDRLYVLRRRPEAGNQ